MELISQKEIEEAAKDFANIKLDIVIDSEERYFNSNVRDYDAFKSGVTFAESKLKDLAVEFAEWIAKSDYIICTDNNEYWWETTEEDYRQISHEELFEIFIILNCGVATT